MVSLDEREAIVLYRFLMAREEQLDADLVPLLTRIERHLYEWMSIEEVEALSRGTSADEAG